MSEDKPKYKLRFFFNYCCGGYLWCAVLGKVG
jgi:hypothetical protein